MYYYVKKAKYNRVTIVCYPSQKKESECKKIHMILPIYAKEI